ncbi:hypothetical protein EKO23_07645 [Nocardioides guangzhouensis]|uniref:Uncharacterized protein n=1 Tax=Nocardioides guangzhouensis TaxID=2497878 RepID=A0A4Q4ZH77_9ACTN|nr:hypothetical protein [Nocardioides guangzhouensis]RYP86841.1 hypothetical protein EKO23_07645 [Nocardioides guangzhouensis]
MTEQLPTVHTQADLEGAWRHLVRPLGWTSRRFWIMLIEAGGDVVPQVIEVDELDHPPGDPELEGGATFLRELVEMLHVPGARVAFLVCRPGTGPAGPDDRAWAGALLRMAQRAGVRCEPTHLATDEEILPIPLDELDAA